MDKLLTAVEQLYFKSALAELFPIQTAIVNKFKKAKKYDFVG